MMAPLGGESQVWIFEGYEGGATHEAADEISSACGYEAASVAKDWR